MIVAAVLAAGALCPQIQGREEPKDWKLLRTDHFEIYYPDEALRERAREFAGWFEEARGLVREATGVEIARTIHVFLYRSYHDLRQASLLGQFAEAPRLGLPRGRGSFVPERRHASECRLAEGRGFALAEPLRDRVLIHVQASDRWNQWFIRHELV